MKNTYAKKGFTLIEVLVAISIFGVLSILSWRALNVLTNGRGYVSRIQEGSGQLQSLSNQLGRDAQFLKNPGSLLIPTMEGKEKQLAFLRISPVAPLETTASSSAENSATFGSYLQVIRYFIDDQKNLWREPSKIFSPQLLNLKSKNEKTTISLTDLSVPMGKHLLAKNISELTLEALTSSGWRVINNLSPDTAEKTPSGSRPISTSGETSESTILFGNVMAIRATFTIDSQKYTKLYLSLS